MDQPVSQSLLRRYFYSGWAFFMPYLFFYLLYYWRKWPVNPGSGSHLPPLLHVYWTLHAIHLVLGILALRSWWQSVAPSTLNPALSQPVVSLSNPSNGSQPSTSSSQLSALSSQPSVFRPLTSGLWPLASRLLPWALLAPIFYIPGVYLEWPSDPWEHLRRINEWHVCQTVGAHSTWVKSSYFLTYSLLGWAYGLRQLFWLDFYYTGICLLLCWQYYRLARAVGLGERASLVFVILQALLFGNNVFSFYRYYGISSSIYAQLGAVALTRLGIEVMSRKSENSSHKTTFRFSLFRFFNFPIFLRSLGEGGCLMLFTAFNHVQGLGIAALGLAAVATWRLIAWKRSAGWILLVTVILLSLATVRWYPRHPAIDQMYRPQGYLNAWHGFNIFSLSSPAGDRMLQIVGAVGLVNLAAGLLLLRRNHLIGWLTVVPLIALCLPCVAIPFAGLLAQHGNEINVVTFQRMLFAIPTGLAISYLETEIIARSAEKSTGLLCRPFFVFTMTIVSLVTLTTISPSSPHYNHFWHTLVQTPADLQMTPVIATLNAPLLQQNNENSSRLLATCFISEVLQSTGVKNVSYAWRTIGTPVTNSANNVIALITDTQNLNSLLFIPHSRDLYTFSSLAGQLSGHWPSQQVASDYATGPELEAAVLKAGDKKLQGSCFYQMGKVPASTQK